MGELSCFCTEFRIFWFRFKGYDLTYTTIIEGTVILDGNKEGKKKFYNQPSIAKGDAKPDIILKEGETYQVIADAKYKAKTKDSDRYQVISHALSYNAKVAILILPKSDGYAGEALVKLGDVGSEYQINVYEYYFNLSSNNLAEEEKKLAEVLLSLYPAD